MQHRRIGTSGLKVSTLGLGCNNFADPVPVNIPPTRAPHRPHPRANPTPVIARFSRATHERVAEDRNTNRKPSPPGINPCMDSPSKSNYDGGGVDNGRGLT